MDVQYFQRNYSETNVGKSHRKPSPQLHHHHRFRRLLEMEDHLFAYVANIFRNEWSRLSIFCMLTSDFLLFFFCFSLPPLFPTALMHFLLPAPLQTSFAPLICVFLQDLKLYELLMKVEAEQPEEGQS